MACAIAIRRGISGFTGTGNIVTHREGTYVPLSVGTVTMRDIICYTIDKVARRGRGGQ